MNPNTREVFYIGATKRTLQKRLWAHYQNLTECERGERKRNKRFDYLSKLLPDKATIHLLETVSNLNLLDERESFYVNEYRKANPKLTNMTDGGAGQYTSKYFTKKEKKEYGLKISNRLKGVPKPDGFSENMSIKRMGIGNPAARLMTDPIVCIENGKVIKIFNYAFEINEYMKNSYAHGNIVASIKRKSYNAYGLQWRMLSEISYSRPTDKLFILKS